MDDLERDIKDAILLQKMQIFVCCLECFMDIKIVYFPV